MVNSDNSALQDALGQTTPRALTRSWNQYTKQEICTFEDDIPVKGCDSEHEMHFIKS